MILSALMLMAGQAAQAAGQTNAPATWPAVGMATVAAAGSWLSIIYTNRKAKKTGVPPGMGATCGAHGKAIEEQGKTLASLAEFRDMTKENIREMKDDIREIRNAVVK